MNKLPRVDSFIIENTWQKWERFSLKFGWGNGYAALPRGHPCFGLSTDDIYRNYNISCPSELTYAGFACNLDAPGQYVNANDYWAVGFDTCHHGDNPTNWPEKRVQKVADQLAFDFLQIWIQKIRNG